MQDLENLKNIKNNPKIKPMALIVLDGFGHRDDPHDNAIALAHAPHIKSWEKTCPHTYVSASGLDVGLPAGQMGNSEVGHMTIGAGRVVYQELTRLDQEILDGSFEKNNVLKSAIESAITNNKALHILGLLSPGGVHSHELHIQAMIKMGMKLGAPKIYLHAFLDGRDTPPRSAQKSLENINLIFKDFKNKSENNFIGGIASITGRYFAMDRDNRWDRIKLAYDLLVHGESEFSADSAVAGLEAAYLRAENDEFVKPTKILSNANIQDGDSVIFMNFRSDRARELSHAFVDLDSEFKYFDRKNKLNLAHYVSLTEYEAGLKAEVAYGPQSLNHVLGQVIAENNLKQLRIAETEKYAHVTFFFNGGLETCFNGEDRILINSPKVATYDLQPEMSAYELTDKLIEAIKSGQYDLIICNYANADMVGHTGNLSAAIQAVEALDICLGKVIQALKSVGGEAVITADHGNAEQMSDPKTGQAHTAHTCELVPVIYTGEAEVLVKQGGGLADIAPTVLNLMGLAIPKEMTGKVLFKNLSGVKS